MPHGIHLSKGDFVNGILLGIGVIDMRSQVRDKIVKFLVRLGTCLPPETVNLLVEMQCILQCLEVLQVGFEFVELEDALRELMDMGIVILHIVEFDWQDDRGLVRYHGYWGVLGDLGAVLVVQRNVDV